MIRDPLRDGKIGAAKGALHRRVARMLQSSGSHPAAGRRPQQSNTSATCLTAMRAMPEMPRVAASSRLIAYKQRSPPLARAGHARLLPHARHESRDDERDDQHDCERHDVLRIRHREREQRRHEEEVECRDVQNGREHRRARDPAAARRP